MGPFEKEGFALIGAAMAVYNEMRPGFLEEVYQECIEIELAERGIPFSSQPTLKLYYRDHELRKYYKPDLYVFDSIVVELKAERSLVGKDYGQRLNYLKGSRKPVGYLINFGHTKDLEWKRLIYT